MHERAQKLNVSSSVQLELNTRREIKYHIYKETCFVKFIIHVHKLRMPLLT